MYSLANPQSFHTGWTKFSNDWWIDQSTTSTITKTIRYNYSQYEYHRVTTREKNFIWKYFFFYVSVEWEGNGERIATISENSIAIWNIEQVDTPQIISTGSIDSKSGAANKLSCCRWNPHITAPIKSRLLLDLIYVVGIYDQWSN